jgi:hypothetical protein
MGYAALSDLYNVMPVAMMGTVTTAQQQQALDDRSAYADSKMRARYALPLGLPYDRALVRAVCDLAAWDIICLRGYDPEGGSDRNFHDRAIGEDGKGGAQKLLDDVERQCAHFLVVEAIQPSPAYPAPLVLSNAQEGWIPPPYAGWPRSGIQ